MWQVLSVFVLMCWQHVRGIMARSSRRLINSSYRSCRNVSFKLIQQGMTSLVVVICWTILGIRNMSNSPPQQSSSSQQRRPAPVHEQATGESGRRDRIETESESHRDRSQSGRRLRERNEESNRLWGDIAQETRGEYTSGYKPFVFLYISHHHSFLNPLRLLLDIFCFLVWFILSFRTDRECATRVLPISRPSGLPCLCTSV